MASDSTPQPQGNAFDKPHHPGNPHLNFLPLYLTIVAIFVMSVGVKILTVILKKRHEKKRDPDVEQQQLDFFEKWWYPWRYDKHGRKKKLPPRKKLGEGDAGSNDGASSGSGESPGTSSSKTPVADAPPQLPALAHHRESALDRLVYRTGGNPADDAAASPALMSGALSPNSLPSPIRLDKLNSRLGRAGETDAASVLSDPDAAALESLISDSDSNSSRSRLPAVNPFTSKPFRSPAPYRSSSEYSGSSTRRSGSNAAGKGYGGLCPLPEQDSKLNNSNRSNSGQSGRSLSRDGQFYDVLLRSAIDERDFSNGYGASTASSSSRDGNGDKRSHISSSSKDKQYRSSRTASSRDKQSSSEPTKERSADNAKGALSRAASSSRHRDPYSRHEGSSSRHTGSSSRQAAPSSSRAAQSSHHPSSSSRAREPSSSRNQTTSSRTTTASSSSPSTGPTNPPPPPVRKGGGSALGGGKFKGVVVQEEQWRQRLREREAEAARKKAEEDAEKKNRKNKKGDDHKGKGKKDK